MVGGLPGGLVAVLFVGRYCLSDHVVECTEVCCKLPVIVHFPTPRLPITRSYLLLSALIYAFVPPPPFPLISILRVISLCLSSTHWSLLLKVLILSSSAAFVGSIVLHYLDVSILCPELSGGDSGADCLPSDECLLCFLSQHQGNSFSAEDVLFLMA